MQRIEILMFNGFDELDVVAPFEIFVSTGFDVELVTLQRCTKAVGSHGLNVIPSGQLGARPDLLVVPGGGWAAKSPVGARAEVSSGLIPAAIAERYAAGCSVAGVCTGAMLLAASGILAGRPAVTHRSAIDDLRGLGVDVRPEARVVDDGDVITSGGVTSGIDLALHIVSRERGQQTAQDEAARIELPVWRSGASL
jgi:transcriptional regulator GlxA family with amidase domain